MQATQSINSTSKSLGEILESTFNEWLIGHDALKAFAYKSDLKPYGLLSQYGGL